jgi:hypothetical protein
LDWGLPFAAPPKSRPSKRRHQLTGSEEGEPGEGFCAVFCIVSF